VVGKHLAEGGAADAPVTRLRHLVLEVATDAQPAPVDGLSTDATAVAEADVSADDDGTETLEQMRERVKLENKQKKPTIPPELLQNANSYEDQLMVVRMIVDQEQSRVASVIRNMIQVK
jgi:hypothetical protein